MKIDRLIGIITILLQRDKVTAPQLAERFEVSRRTINRDIEDICKAGIPIVSMQGYGGGISIANGYKIEKSLFTKEELQAVLVGLQGMDSVSKSSTFEALIDKFSDRESRVMAEDMIIIDLASHYQTSLTTKIETIKRAIREHYILAFQYYSKDGESKRRMEPYRLVFKWSSWYVFGFCLEKKAYRLFKLNRLWDLELLKESFCVREIPKEELVFEDYFSSANFHLKALFAPNQKHRLIEEYGVDCYDVREDGKLFLEQDFVSYENMRQWIFSFGDQVQILEPETLQRDRKKQAENIIKEVT